MVQITSDTVQVYPLKDPSLNLLPADQEIKEFTGRPFGEVAPSFIVKS
jgi:protein-disulfide isomerase-like protein with CxxC motif